MLFGGIIGTVVVIMFGGLIPLQYKLGLQVGAAMALAIGPFFIGAISTEAAAFAAGISSNNQTRSHHRRHRKFRRNKTTIKW